MKPKIAGAEGEGIAAAHLQRLGYELLERNYQTKMLDEFDRPTGEADIIAERGEVLVFAEVRTRATVVFGHPEETVTRPKRTRIVNAAIDYLTRHQIHDRAVRFDVISVLRRGENFSVQHLEDAFDAGR